MPCMLRNLKKYNFRKIGTREKGFEAFQGIALDWKNVWPILSDKYIMNILRNIEKNICLRVWPKSLKKRVEVTKNKNRSVPPLNN